MNWLKKLFGKKPEPCCEACCMLPSEKASEISTKNVYWSTYCGIAEGIKTQALAGEHQYTSLYYLGNPPHENTVIVGILNDIKVQLEDLGYVVDMSSSAGNIHFTVAWV